VELIIEPDDGVAPLLALIKTAKQTINMAIFRFDRRDLETALKTAVGNGVKVNTLIAYSNHGGEKSLRKLEMRFLEAGMTVARSASDLIRYHDKLMVVDQHILCVLSFNFTHVDIDRSRGFAVITENNKCVAEALKLLDADCKRTPYECSMDTFVVSPSNARKTIGDFLKDANKQLSIYDPNISDREMIRILKDRVKAGVEVRVIGETKAPLAVKRLSKLRLHTRTIIRDEKHAFLGSQSLRAAELDSRREVGLIVNDTRIVRRLVETFESDWASGVTLKEQPDGAAKTDAPKQDAEKALAVLVEELHPIANTVKKAVQRVVAQAGEEMLEDGRVKETVKKVVKRVVKQAVKEARRA
jgi:cardiolipin synthase A/B